MAVLVLVLVLMPAPRGRCRRVAASPVDARPGVRGQGAGRTAGEGGRRAVAGRSDPGRGLPGTGGRLTASPGGRFVPCAGARRTGTVGSWSTGRLPQWRRRRDVALAWLATGVVVAAVYAGVMLLGREVTGASAPLWLAILATGAVAVVIGPAQRWAAQATARVLRGSREPPYAVLAGFPARMEGGDAVTELPARMARLLAEATGARWAQVWLILGDRPTLVASHPPTTSTDLPPPSPSSRATGLRSVTVGHRGELLGFLRLQEHPGHPLTPVEERLFAGLAAQAGLALHAARVRAELETRHADLALRAAELRAARTRLVAAQDDARRRLERDIHDGAQQQLVALGINLRLAQTLADRDRDPDRDLGSGPGAAPGTGHRGRGRAGDPGDPGPGGPPAGPARGRARGRPARGRSDVPPAPDVHRRPRRRAAGAGRGGALLLRAGGRPERRQARARRLRADVAGGRAPGSSGSGWSTTGEGSPTPTFPGRGGPTSANGWLRWAVTSRCGAGPRAGPRSPSRCRSRRRSARERRPGPARLDALRGDRAARRGAGGDPGPCGGAAVLRRDPRRRVPAGHPRHRGRLRGRRAHRLPLPTPPGGLALPGRAGRHDPRAGHPELRLRGPDRGDRLPHRRSVDDVGLAAVRRGVRADAGRAAAAPGARRPAAVTALALGGRGRAPRHRRPQRRRAPRRPPRPHGGGGGAGHAVGGPAAHPDRRGAPRGGARLRRGLPGPTAASGHRGRAGPAALDRGGGGGPGPVPARGDPAHAPARRAVLGRGRPADGRLPRAPGLHRRGDPPLAPLRHRRHPQPVDRALPAHRLRGPGVRRRRGGPGRAGPRPGCLAVVRRHRAGRGRLPAGAPPGHPGGGPAGLRGPRGALRGAGRLHRAAPAQRLAGRAAPAHRGGGRPGVRGRPRARVDRARGAATDRRGVARRRVPAAGARGRRPGRRERRAPGRPGGDDASGPPAAQGRGQAARGPRGPARARLPRRPARARAGRSACTSWGDRARGWPSPRSG